MSRSGIGETRVTTPITIDRLTIDGILTGLDVRASGTLNVWSDFTVAAGIVNVDGRMNTGEALMISGLLSGRGTFNPTYFTSINGAIAPGGIGSIGTLTVQADTVFASNSVASRSAPPRAICCASPPTLPRTQPASPAPAGICG